MHSAVLQFNVFLALTHLFIATRGTEPEAKKTEKSIPSTTADISRICSSVYFPTLGFKFSYLYGISGIDL